MLETFQPFFSLNSRHKLAPVSGTVEWMQTLKGEMESCGWHVIQEYVGRGVVLAGSLPTAPPLAPGEVPSPAIVHKKLPNGSGIVGGANWQFYDPIRQIPGGDGGVFWVKEGIGSDYLSTAGELGVAIASALGCIFVGMDNSGLPYGQVYLIFDQGLLGKAGELIFGEGLMSGVLNYSDPYFNVNNTTLGHFAVQGAGWDLLSADGTTVIQITERLDTLNYHQPGPKVGTAPYLRIKPATADSYRFLYPFSLPSAVVQYHFHCSDKQVIIWMDGAVGPTGRPNSIIISSLAFTDDPPSFLGANLYQVLVVIGSTISQDGSYFSGDDNGNLAQARDHLWYVRGVAQDFYSYNEGESYSQSHGGPGAVNFTNGQIGFVFRGLDNGRNLLATNGEPLAQTPWMLVPKTHGTAPSWIAGRIRDAMILSYAPTDVTSEPIIKAKGKRWHLLSSQNLGGQNLNGSLWLTAVHDSTET